MKSANPSRWACLIPVLVLGSCQALAQEFPTQMDVWNLRCGQASIDSVDILGSGNFPGFKFTIAARGDGALPLVTFLANITAVPMERIVICKRVDATTYANFCNWNHVTGLPSAQGGILLSPGDYFLLGTKDPGTLANLAGTVMLGGRWVGAAYQNDYWSLVPGANAFVSRRQVNGDPIVGIRFAIQTRADGAKPVVTDLTTVATQTVVLYRRLGNGSYALYSDWKMAPHNQPHGIILEPGEYILQAPMPLFANAYRYASILTGYWAIPAP